MAGEKQVDRRTGWSFTVISKADQKQPLVLEDEWYPPEGVSALPVDFQKAVPEGLRYWEEEDEEQRHEMLDALREAWDGESLESLSDGTERVDVRIAKEDYEKQLIYGVVLSPFEIDSWGDFEKPEEIEDAAHRYLFNVWEGDKPESIGKQHQEPIDARPVESFIAPCDFWYEGSPREEAYKVPKGAWVLVTHIENKQEFKKAVEGTYSGYSLQGVGRRKKATEKDKSEIRSA